MGSAGRVLGVAVFGLCACGGPIDDRLPGGETETAVSTLVPPEREPEAPAPDSAVAALPSSSKADGPGFGGSGNAGLGEEVPATDAVSAQSLIWTRALMGDMGFRPVGR